MSGLETPRSVLNDFIVKQARYIASHWESGAEEENITLLSGGIDNIYNSLHTSSYRVEQRDSESLRLVEVPLDDSPNGVIFHQDLSPQEITEYISSGESVVGAIAGHLSDQIIEMFKTNGR